MESESSAGGVDDYERCSVHLTTMMDEPPRRSEEAVSCEPMIVSALMGVGERPQSEGPALSLVQASSRPAEHYQVRSDQDKVIYQILLRAVKKSCPRWLSDQAEDLAQKSMLRLLEKDAKADEAGSYCASYLYQVAGSVVLNEIRSHRRRSQRVLIAKEPDVETKEVDPVTQNNPEQGVVAEQTKSRVFACLERISKDRRAALLLGIQGYTTKQIAQRLGWETKRTQNLLTRGRQDLRACLGKEGGDR